MTTDWQSDSTHILNKQSHKQSSKPDIESADEHIVDSVLLPNIAVHSNAAKEKCDDEHAAEDAEC